MNLTFSHCRFYLLDWPDSVMRPINKVDFIRCRYNAVDFGALMLMASPRQLRLYGEYQGELRTIFGFVASMENLQTIVLYDLVNTQFFGIADQEALHSLVRAFIIRGKPVNLTFNGDEFSQTHDMDFSTQRVNHFRMGVGNGGRRAWTRVQYDSRNTVFLRDIHGGHLVASPEMWF